MRTGESSQISVWFQNVFLGSEQGDTPPVTSRPPGNLLLGPVKIQIERRLQLSSMQDASCAIDEGALLGLGSVWVYLIKTILKQAKHRLAREGGKESFSCFMTMCYDTAAGEDQAGRPAPSRPSKGSIQGGTYRPPVRSDDSTTK